MTTRQTAKPKFTYRAHTADDMKRRAAQGGSARDGFVNQDVKFYTPRAGDNRVRILPPTWDNAKHYGHDVFVHYRIGADASSYACLDKMTGNVGVCPICKERAKAEAAGEEEMAYQWAPKKRISCYVIDRDHEDEGVLMWNMPWTVDRDICAQAVDKSSGEVFNVDDPDGGYDLSFNKQGTAMTTKYTGVQIARRSTPLSDDPDQAEAWLAYAMKNPIPDMIVLHDADHIGKVFAGSVGSVTEAAAETPKATAPTKPTAVVTPVRRALAPKAAPMPPTRAVILAMTEDALVDMIEKENLADAIGDRLADMPLPELAAAVADAMGLTEEPVAKAPVSASNSLKERLARLQAKT